MKAKFIILRRLSNLAAGLIVINSINAQTMKLPPGFSIVVIKWYDVPNPNPDPDTTFFAKEIKLLTKVIVDAQIKYVRESFGPKRGQCFTDSDLIAFSENAIATKIGRNICSRNDIKSVINTFRKNKFAVVQKAVSQLKVPTHFTWEQLGEVSPLGQTRAGQKAEYDIASGIIDAILQFCLDPTWYFNQALK